MTSNPVRYPGAVGGLPEAVTPEARVPAGDVEALAQRLSALLAHPQAWPALGRAGRAWVESRFDQCALVARWFDHYRRIAHA